MARTKPTRFTRFTNSCLWFSCSSSSAWNPSLYSAFLESGNQCVRIGRPIALQLLTSAVYLVGAALLFAIGQIFQYVISVHICTGSSGKINGGLFETLFTLLDRKSV